MMARARCHVDRCETRLTRTPSFRKFEARDAEVDVSKLRDHVPKRNGKSSNGATTSDAVVEGFAGTGLHGFEARRRERDLSSHSTPNPATDVDNDAEMAAALAVELNGPEASTVSRAVADAACPSCASHRRRRMS